MLPSTPVRRPTPGASLLRRARSWARLRGALNTTSHRLRSGIVAAALALSVPAQGLVSSDAARAALPRNSAERSERLSAEAQDAYVAGRFEEAIRLYLRAFNEMADPSILYNIGFIYERKLDDLELALGYYERVATAPDVPAELAAKAQGRLEGVRAALDARRAVTPSPGRNPERPGDPPEGAPDPGVSASLAGERGVSAGPVLLMAAGGALVLGGAISGSLAVDTQARYASARSEGDAAAARDLRSKGRTEALIADVLLIGGAATALGGLIWLLVDAPADSPAVSWGVGPVSGGAALSIGGGF